MSTEKKDNNKILPPKAPKGNYQLWVILVTVAVILGVMYLNSSNTATDLVGGQERLKQMIESGDVKKVVLIKNRN
jgi:AFG3 family protein